MGNISNSFCGKDTKTDKYLQMIQTAIKLAGDNSEDRSLLVDHKQKLEAMIKNGAQVEEKLGSRYKAEIVLTHRFDIPSEFIHDPTEKEVKLILTTEIQESVQFYSNHSINTQQGILRKGFIIFPKACYYGSVLKQKAHGLGTLYCPGYEIHGEWHRDSLKDGIIYKLQPVLNKPPNKILICELELLNGERQAIVKTSKFKYRGSITLKGAQKITQILTGQGVIVYNNKDQYSGSLVKGFYETSGTKLGVYTYAQGECKSYSGGFKNGLREDRGFFSIQAEGKKFTMNVKYSKGELVQSGVLHLEQDNREYQIEARDSNLVIGSRLDDNSQ